MNSLSDFANYVAVYKNDRITQEMSFMRATASRDEIERFRLKQARLGTTWLMKERRLLPNASYFAFTATPKNKTLEIFGLAVPQVDGAVKHLPFHVP